MVFCRHLDGCETNKGDIMGYNEQWSFSMEFYSKTSKLP